MKKNKDFKYSDLSGKRQDLSQFVRSDFLPILSLALCAISTLATEASRAMECERHSGDFQHWRNFGSHCQTPKIQSIRRIQH